MWFFPALSLSLSFALHMGAGHGCFAQGCGAPACLSNPSQSFSADIKAHGHSRQEIPDKKIFELFPSCDCGKPGCSPSPDEGLHSLKALGTPFADGMMASWEPPSHPLSPMLGVSSFFKSQTHFSSLYFYHCHCHCSRLVQIGNWPCTDTAAPFARSRLCPQNQQEVPFQGWGWYCILLPIPLGPLHLGPCPCLAQDPWHAASCLTPTSFPLCSLPKGLG